MNPILELIKSLTSLGANTVGAATTIATTGAGVVTSIARLQTSIVNMTTGFEIGFGPMVKAFNDSVEAVHKQEQQTTAMGTQRASLIGALESNIAGFDEIPGNIDEKMSTAIGLFQFGIGANMESSLKLATQLRLQGAAGLALVKGFASMGRSLFLTQDAIDVLQDEIMKSTASQSITTEALVRGLSETAAALKPAAMIDGLGQSLMKLGTIAGQDLGEAGMGAFNALIAELTKASSIQGGSLMGIEMGWINDLVALSASDPAAAYEMLKEKITAAGLELDKFGGGPGTDIRQQIQMLEEAFGPLGPAVMGFITAVKNAEQGVGAARLGGLEVGDTASTILTKNEELFNEIRKQAHELGDLQERNAVALFDSFEQQIVFPVAEALNEFIVGPLTEGDNILDFAQDFSESFGTLLDQIKSVFNVGVGSGSPLGPVLSGFSQFNDLIVNTLIPSLTSAISTLLVGIEAANPDVDTARIRAGLATPDIVAGRAGGPDAGAITDNSDTGRALIAISEFLRESSNNAMGQHLAQLARMLEDFVNDPANNANPNLTDPDNINDIIQLMPLLVPPPATTQP
tara:strand:- start:16627 stop:18348 length:1722 start_codon:yes stop_codon:yes gene_type:complete